MDMASNLRGSFGPRPHDVYTAPPSFSNKQQADLELQYGQQTSHSPQQHWTTETRHLLSNALPTTLFSFLLPSGQGYPGKTSTGVSQLDLTTGYPQRGVIDLCSTLRTACLAKTQGDPVVVFFVFFAYTPDQFLNLSVENMLIHPPPPLFSSLFVFVFVFVLFFPLTIFSAFLFLFCRWRKFQGNGKKALFFFFNLSLSPQNQKIMPRGYDFYYPSSPSSIPPSIPGMFLFLSPLRCQ